jgi:Na+/H+ antiporter NhaD/arsenite permease-like protein
VPILLATILAFFFHKQLHLEPATVALAGASVMLLVTRQSMQETIGNIEWPTLFFLIGLFVMVGALEHTGARGNATIVGAAANVAASGMASRAGHPIGFMTFMKYGLVVTLVSLVLSTLYVMVRYA